MRHAAKTYGAIAAQTANPRELEADLLLNAAARLQAIHDGWDAKQARARRGAATLTASSGRSS